MSEHGTCERCGHVSENRGMDCIYSTPYGALCPDCMYAQLQTVAEARALLEKAVCTEGEDAGVILLSQDAPTHIETHDGRELTVYELEYFSPLGECLMEAWKTLGGEPTEEAK
jgi:hypothetical protein